MSSSPSARRSASINAYSVVPSPSSHAHRSQMRCLVPRACTVAGRPHSQNRLGFRRRVTAVFSVRVTAPSVRRSRARASTAAEPGGGRTGGPGRTRSRTRCRSARRSQGSPAATAAPHPSGQLSHQPVDHHVLVRHPTNPTPHRDPLLEARNVHPAGVHCTGTSSPSSHSTKCSFACFLA